MATNEAWLTIEVGNIPMKVGRVKVGIDSNGDLNVTATITNPTAINLHATEGVVMHGVIMDFAEEMHDGNI